MILCTLQIYFLFQLSAKLLQDNVEEDYARDVREHGRLNEAADLLEAVSRIIFEEQL